MPPFAGYSDFADCVSKNQGKDNPEAYCGSIKAKVEKKMSGQKILKSVSDLLTKQGPPGPPPRPGLQWNAQSHRWIKPFRPEDVPPAASEEHAARFQPERDALSAIADLKEGGEFSDVQDAVFRLYPTVQNPDQKRALKTAWQEMANDPNHPGRWDKLEGVVSGIMDGPISRMLKGQRVISNISAVLKQLDK